MNPKHELTVKDAVRLLDGKFPEFREGVSCPFGEPALLQPHNIEEALEEVPEDCYAGGQIVLGCSNYSTDFYRQICTEHEFLCELWGCPGPETSIYELQNNHEFPLMFLIHDIHSLNEKWWQDPETGEPIERNVGELLMLVTSELAEAMEADRKGLQDDKLPHRKGLEVELADAVIRIFDMAGGLKLDLSGALFEKLHYNAQRADHKPENRIKDGGKKY